VTIEMLANFAEIAGGIMIVGGAIFGLVQLRELKQQRITAVTSELMRTFYSTDLSYAVSMMHELPDGISVEELRNMGPEYERAAVLICTNFETMGLLVFERIASYRTVQDLAGGMITSMWRKLSVWTNELRLEQDQPSWAEWFQWLAERMAQTKSETVPAYEKHRDWRAVSS
jgi:hypothetical protein